MRYDPKLRRHVENILDQFTERNRLKTYVASWTKAVKNGIHVDSIKSAVIGDIFGRLMTFTVSIESDLSPSRQFEQRKVVDIVTTTFAGRYLEINSKLSEILDE